MVGKIITHKNKQLTWSRGWFEVAGQFGHYNLEERLVGLQPLESVATNATILDLGCAEGVIGLHLLKIGPGALLHGVDNNLPALLAARMLARRQGLKARFFQFDFDDLSNWTGALLPRYDIVLCLCVAHKLRNPELFLRQVVSLCSGYLALQLPATTIDDPRSDHRELDTNALLIGALGFDLFHVEDGMTSTPFSRRIYRRRTPNAYGNPSDGGG